jgi:FtsZ-interacting cell division protein YlmF
VAVGNYTIKVEATEDSFEAEKQVQILIEEEKVYEKALFIGVNLKRDQSVKFNFLELDNNTSR